MYNVAQNYVTLKQSKEVYSGKSEQSESRREAQPLSAVPACGWGILNTECSSHQ